MDLLSLFKEYGDKQLNHVTDFMKRYIGHIDQSIKESENNGEGRQ